MGPPPARTTHEAARRRPRRSLPAHRGERRVALAVHEKPDADALGAAAGMLDLFSQLGVDAELWVSADELLPLGDVLVPADRVRKVDRRPNAALYALDSGNPDRLALPAGATSR